MQMPIQAPAPVIAAPRRPTLPRWVAQAARFSVVPAVAIAVALIVYRVLPALEQAGGWAYLVGFLVQGVTSATIVIPIPGLAALTVMSQDLNIFALAAAGAAGGSIGELTGYWVGSQGRGIIENTRIMQRVRPHMERRGALIVALFAAVPILPMDAAGMLAGSTRYPVTRFLAAMFVGKFILLTVTFLSARGLFSFIG